jgi:hypothetical protein
MALVSFETDEASVIVPREPKKMITLSEEGGRTKVEINSSSLSVIQECLRKSDLLLNQKWKTETENPATIFGSSIHKALEVFYSAPPEERKLVSLEQLEMTVARGNPDGDSAPLLVRSAAAFAKRAEVLSPLPDHDKRSLINGAWILHHYFKTFIDDPYVALVDESGPFIERTFTYRLFEDETLIIDIFGTIDFAFRHTANGNILLGDHKTASSLGFGSSSYFDRDKPNHQYTMYMLGARRVFGIETEEFMVNVLEVKARPKTARGSGPSFPRQITKRNEEDFAELTPVVIKAVRDYLSARTSGVWPLGPVLACNAYGACSYKQVCASPVSLRETILKSKFVKDA